MTAHFPVHLARSPFSAKGPSRETVTGIETAAGAVGEGVRDDWAAVGGG
jgi:hypothetical protein